MIINTSISNILPTDAILSRRAKAADAPANTTDSLFTNKMSAFPASIETTNLSFIPKVSNSELSGTANWQEIPQFAVKPTISGLYLITITLYVETRGSTTVAPEFALFDDNTADANIIAGTNWKFKAIKGGPTSTHSLNRTITAQLDAAKTISGKLKGDIKTVVKSDCRSQMTVILL